MHLYRSRTFVRMSLGPFNGILHRLTSPRFRTLSDLSPVRTRRKSAPFRVRYFRVCGPIRPLTGRPSLSPSSPTLCPVPLPCGRDTTSVGSIGLPQLSMEKSREDPVGVCAPVGFLDVVAPTTLRRPSPRTVLVMACQPLWPFAVH